MRPRLALLLLLPLAGACAAQLDTEELAEATSRACVAPPGLDREELLELVESTGRRIKIRRHGEGYTVLPRTMLAPPNFEERSDASVEDSLEHEFAHMCRSEGRRIGWTIHWLLDPDQRLEEEIAGLLEQAARKAARGIDAEAFIRDRLSKFRKRYGLKLDPVWVESTLIPAMLQAIAP